MALDSLQADFEQCALTEPGEASDSASVTTPYGERLLQPDEIRLLSIHRGTDGLHLSVAPHNLQDDLEYDAVSYVWGTAVASINIPCNGVKLAVTPTVFQMLQYLDPNRSYWLDSVCINQQDSEEKEIQIPLMHRIYSLAAFVVMWMGLPTPQSEKFMLCFPSALEKVKEWNSTVNQTIEPWVHRQDLFVKDEHFWHGMAQVCTHEWFDRLWTFQEAVLAEQPIMLLGPLWLKFDEVLEFVDQGFFTTTAYIPYCLQHLKLRVNFGASTERFHKMGIQRDDVLSNGAVGIYNIPFLLDALRDRHVKEPVDRAWAITGLLSDHLRSELESVVDYSHQARVNFWKTHMRFASTIIVAEQTLCLLKIPPTIEGRPQSSPSWCPVMEGVPACEFVIVGRWVASISRQPNRVLLREDTDEGDQTQYSSAPEKLAIPYVSRKFVSVGEEDSNLHCRGHVLDTISEVVKNQELRGTYEYLHSKGDYSVGRLSNPVHAANVDVYIRSLHLAHRTARNAEENSDSIPPEYLMTLLLDTRIATEAAIAYKDGWDLFRDGDFEPFSALSAERQLRAKRWVIRLYDLAGHSFFSTTGGRFGIATPGCKPGDKVCVFFGERPLHILRWPEPEHETGAIHGEGPAEFCGVAFIPHLMKPHEQEAARLGPDEIFVIA